MVPSRPSCERRWPDESPARDAVFVLELVAPLDLLLVECGVSPVTSTSNDIVLSLYAVFHQELQIFLKLLYSFCQILRFQFSEFSRMFLQLRLLR
jgi:hypothetical protein